MHRRWVTCWRWYLSSYGWLLARYTLVLIAVSLLVPHCTALLASMNQWKGTERTSSPFCWLQTSHQGILPIHHSWDIHIHKPPPYWLLNLHLLVLVIDNIFIVFFVGSQHISYINQQSTTDTCSCQELPFSEGQLLHHHQVKAPTACSSSDSLSKPQEASTDSGFM